MPKNVEKIIDIFLHNNLEIFIVGGSVRDLLMGRNAIDWDLTTNATPEEMLKFLPKAKYNNDFGTVIVPIKSKEGETEQVLEITTYRSEQGYADHRRPDEVKFESDLDKDLERRDFTVNAMALGFNKDKSSLDKYQKKLGTYLSTYQDTCFIVDLFGGEKDIKKKIIRAVGEPVDRFKEDGLRMMRAVRFMAQLGFVIEPKTERAIMKMAGSLKFIAKERIRDELVKTISSEHPYAGMMKLHQLKLLQYIIPELYKGENMPQNHHHKYSVFEHTMLSLKYCPNPDWRVRLAAWLHDIGKPSTRKFINGGATFYNHEYAGERIVRKMMRRLNFSNEDTAKVTNLIRNHMFYYNVDEVTATSVRRLIRKVGRENLSDLIDVRIADRLGSGTPKAVPYKLRHLQYMMEKVQNDPVSVKMLKINGNDLMKELGLEPGPKIGAILDVLLSDVIEEPKNNNYDYLLEKARELMNDELETLREKAKEVIEEKREEEDKEMKKGYYVR